jgi:hypothetical protein
MVNTIVDVRLESAFQQDIAVLASAADDSGTDYIAHFVVPNEALKCLGLLQRFFVVSMLASTEDFARRLQTKFDITS